MFRLVTPMILFALVLAACATSEEPASTEPAAPPATTKPDSPDTTSAAPTTAAPPAEPTTTASRPASVAEPGCAPDLAAAFDAWGAAGFDGSVAILDRGEFTCLVGYGEADRRAGEPITADTVFSIGSISKAVTAAAIVQLADDGVVDLDDAAGEWVEDLSPPGADATLRQLLVHTSGITGTHGRDHRPLGLDDAVAAIDALDVTFPAGTDFLYSNAGYSLLALVVEAATGDFRTYVTQEVLDVPGRGVIGGFWDGEPAAPGPRAIGYFGSEPGDTGEIGDFAGPHWALDGNGGLAMTPADLVSWTRALFTGDLISDQAADVVATIGFDNGDGSGESPGWVVVDEAPVGEAGYVASGGGGSIGHDAVVAWFPASDRVVAVASNGGRISSGDMLEAVLPAFLAGEPLPAPPTQPERADVDPAVLVAIAGTYEIDGATGPATADDENGDVGAEITVDVDLPADAFEVAVVGDGIEVTATGPVAIATIAPPTDEEQAAGMARHEELVRALLAGETDEGRSERELIEAEIGPITDARVVGTVWAGFEFRTYVEIVADETVTGWFALDERGGIAGVDIGSGPTLPFFPTVDGTFVPDDPTGAIAPVEIVFNGDTMTVTGPSTTTTARRVP